MLRTNIIGVEHISKEIIKLIGKKSIITNIYRIQACDSIMCGYFCIGFIDFMLKGKSLRTNIIGVEHISKEIIKLIGNKSIITNIYRIQACDSIMCGYFCIGFIDFMLKGKSLLEYANLFTPNEYEKKEKIILKYFVVMNIN